MPKRLSVITPTVTVGEGGTGIATATAAGGIVYTASTTAYGTTAAGTTGQFLKSGVAGAPTWATLTTTDVTNAASLSYVQSFGTDLIANGFGTMGTNYNFSTWTYTASDAPNGAAASFLSVSHSQQSMFLDEYMPISTTKTYQFSFQARQTDISTTSCLYGMLVPYDAYKNSISPQMYMYTASTQTTLAVALNNGDTTITLTSSANWYGSAGKPAGASTYLRSIIFWDYVDAGGKAWGIGTYSRNFTTYDMWADSSLVGNVITLRVPWAGGNKAIGTPLSNGSSGGVYLYGGAVNTVIPLTWTAYSGVITGVSAGGVQAGFGVGWPPGTSYAGAGFLVNYTTDWANSRHAVAAVSLSDASAAQSLAVHLAGTETVTGAKTFSALLTASASAVVTGSLTVSTTLGVTGNATFSSTVSTGALTTTGGHTVSGTLLVGPAANQYVTIGGGAANHGMEFGRQDNVASTPYMDFHSGATSIDYDARLIASGGTGSLGGGTLSITAATVAVSATLTAATLTLTNKLAVAQGGTGVSTAPAAGSVIYGVSTTAYGATAAGTTGQVLTSNGAGAPTWAAAGGAAAEVISSLMMMGG